MPTPFETTPRRALFIIVNMHRMPLVFLAEEISDRATLVAVLHDTGRAAVNAEFVLDAHTT
jgi:hypothetical protein